MIDVKHLTKSYKGLPVVDDFSFNVTQGQSVALWGPNGAGKTTILRCLLGLISHQGHITIDGYDTKQVAEKTRSFIGYVPQESNLYGNLTVNETLALSCRLRKIPLTRAREITTSLNLDGLGKKRVKELSGGMRQKLAIGISLLSNPPILLLDEPSSSLDLATQHQITSLLQSIKRPDRSFILTSHRVQEVEALADRVIALDNGRKTQDCPAREFASSLGLQTWLQITLPPHQCAPAQTRLEAAGFDAQQLSGGVLLNLPSNQRAAALSFLHNARFDVLDFEVRQ